MQTQSDASDQRPAPTLAFSTSGLFQDTYRVAWGRRDWKSLVGMLDDFQHVRYTHDGYVWQMAKIPRLRLSHTASMFLLQGMQLKHLLLPNYYVQVSSGSITDAPWGDVLLRVDPWDFRKPIPELTNLVVADFLSIPDAVVQQLLPTAVALSRT